MKKEKFLNFLRYKLPVLLWGLIIFTVSSMPHVPHLQTERFPLDKCAHLIEYGVFNFLLIRALYFNKNIFLKKKAVLLAFIISALVAAVDELHQTLIPGRFGSIMDFWADLGGIFFSQILFVKISKPDKFNENC